MPKRPQKYLNILYFFADSKTKRMVIPMNLIYGLIVGVGFFTLLFVVFLTGFIWQSSINSDLNEQVQKLGGRFFDMQAAYDRVFDVSYELVDKKPMSQVAKIEPIQQVEQKASKIQTSEAVESGLKVENIRLARTAHKMAVTFDLIRKSPLKTAQKGFFGIELKTDRESLLKPDLFLNQNHRPKAPFRFAIKQYAQKTLTFDVPGNLKIQTVCLYVLDSKGRILLKEYLDMQPAPQT